MEDKNLFSKMYRILIRETLVPLCLMVVTPNLAVLFPYIIIFKNSELIQSIDREGLMNLLKEAWRTVRWAKDFEIPLIIAFLLLWGAVSIVTFGGKDYFGPIAMSGFVPEYTHSGFRFYVVSMSLAIPIILYFPMLHVYFNFVSLAGYLSVIGIVICVLVYIKGLLWPSPGVFGSSNNPLFDFYWGLELYPRIGEELDLKQLINCRFGLFLWQLIVLICWKANFELYRISYWKGDIDWSMAAAALLQTIYLAKFFWWEDGYMQTIDIAVDKFGFYEAWGCTAFVPTFYTLTSLYLVKNSPMKTFGFFKFLVTMVLGLSMIFMNYLTDRQKQLARQEDGKLDIWGEPATVIRATYVNEDGERIRSILLASGYWGYARHINYAFEMGACLVWSSTAYNKSIIPYLYFLFLTVLLVHRSFRDEEKCRIKYGKYWDMYCKKVPKKIIPFIF